MDKFKVGQLVWSLSHCKGLWSAATITCAREPSYARCIHCGHESAGNRYEVTFDDDKVAPSGIWLKDESQLRPRDPDQFKAADDYFDWRVLTKPKEPTVANRGGVK